jgi:hypothetical protein
MDLDGSNHRELTVDGQNAFPKMTPDGKTIVFVTNRASGRGIWRMNPDGSGAQPIAAVSDPSYLDISPDGRTVFFTSSRDGTSSSWRVPIEGGTPVLVVREFDRAAVSPDGKQLAGIYQPGDGGLKLGIASIADGKVTQTFGFLPLTTQGGVVLWAADGKGVLLTSAERTNIWLQKLTGEAPAKVTNFSDQEILRAHRSVDGQFLLTARGNSVRDAFLITNFR